METFRSPLAALLLCFALPLLAAAQEPPRKFRITVAYDGPELFARLLDHAKLQAIESLDGVEAAKTIVVVFGDCSPLFELEKKDGGIQGFLDRGGALLIATDRLLPFSELKSLDWGDGAIDGIRYTNTAEQYKYRNNIECPFLFPTISVAEFQFGAMIPKERPHPIFHSLRKPVALNCPSAIVGKNSKLKTLAYLPPGSTDRSEDVSDPKSKPAFLAAGVSDRVLVAAGHGLFTNCMLAQDDIDNRQFALNVIHWLKDDKRTHVLFLSDNQAITNLKAPLVGPPKTPLPTMEAINRLLGSIQSSGLLQRFADRLIGPEDAVRWALVFGTLALLVYGFKKYLQGRWTLEAAPAAIGAPPAKTPSLVKQQVREMVSREQLGEAARALARDWFRTYAKIDFPAGQPPAELSFKVHAGLLQRRSLAKQVEALWRLASEPSAAGWNVKKLRELAVSLEELALSVGGRQVVFETTGGAKKSS